jgi:aerobic C4-dicarboxylate transport protein
MAAAPWEDFTILQIAEIPLYPSVPIEVAGRRRKPLWREPYVLVVAGAVLGAVVGALFPALAVDFKPLGDVFISLIKMTITPLIFLVVVTGVVRIVVALAPIGAFGAMAFTVAKFGVATLYALAMLVGTAWAMMAFFILVGLGTLCRTVGIRLSDLVRLLRTELLVVIGTSSSETAIPGMMEKLPAAGVGRAVAGLVIPAGYSFNLDGVALTLPLSTMFVAQVYGIEMTLAQQLSLFVVMLFTSKGAAGVTGGAFAALAATVIAAGLPAEGLALLLGVDRLMSLGRAVTNTIGNAVAAIVVAKWDGEFDRQAWTKLTALPFQSQSET